MGSSLHSPAGSYAPTDSPENTPPNLDFCLWWPRPEYATLKGMRGVRRFVLLALSAIAAAAGAMVGLGGATASATSVAGLVASYSFDEGTGASAADSSGNARTATIVGATWTAAGKFGSALAFDGNNGRVDLPSLGTFYKNGFTLEAWVKKASAKQDEAVVGSWAGGADGGPMIW